MQLLNDHFPAAVFPHPHIFSAGMCVFWGVTHQRDEVGERERQLHVDHVLLLLGRTQLFVVSSSFEQVMDDPLLLIPAPTP